jgi:uncharacterized membrane protein YccC
MSGAAAARSLRAVVVPEWLAEVVRPRRAPVPWPEMARAALAICVPLSVSFAAGRPTLGVLPAMGGLLGTMADAGGPYLSRVKRVCSAAVFGGAAGLTIGAVTHGHGWLAVVALVVVAGASGLLSARGDIGSVTGLQLLVYTSLGAGPVGALRPVWHTAAGFLVGVLWALILILPGWLRAPYGREQRDVATVYDALAGLLRSVGGGGFTAARQALTTALNTAYDEVLPLQRSYWVPLTVAIVLKPDYGSVFARALQRGIGTVVGAVAGAVLLVLVHGTWLLIPFGVLAALLPFGRSRNYGLLATFLTPLVVVLIDLLNPGGWWLAEDRLIDTLIGCAIVLLIGFAPWPMSWYSHLPPLYARAALDVCRYVQEALGGSGDSGVSGPDRGGGSGSGVGEGAPPVRSRMRRSTYRALADLRAEFQRTMSEPPAISRRATAWWPAVIALEQVMDAITATALAVSRGAQVPPSGVRQLCDALRAVSEAAATGSALAEPPDLPDDETLRPVTDAVRALLGVLGTGERLTV